MAALQPNASAQSIECQQDTVDDSGDSIRVYVRARPLVTGEQAPGTQPALSLDRPSASVHLRGEHQRSFTFDGVLGEDSSQDDVFDLVGRSIGASCLSGYNGSVYVYGQTGTGKTYTMSGPVSSVQSMQCDERRGLICRLLDYIFTEIHRRRLRSEDVSYICRCSFLEIYKEQITDLLEPSNTNLQVREDMSRGIYVERLNEPPVASVTEAFQVLHKGLQQRHIGATHMNERSSRSHALFNLSVEVAQTRAGVTTTRVARLSLVDLAGSERQQGVIDMANGATVPFQSLRVKEAAAINKSLSALTHVIMSLSREERCRRRSSAGADGAGRRTNFVHYRDSKLTFLLRDSLGGNSKTVIVANISPSAVNAGETLSTLKFAARAKHIRCAAVRNEEFSGTVESLMQEVKALRQQLAVLSGRGFAGTQSQLSLSDSATAVGRRTDPDDEEHSEEEEVLYSRKRVRRLEVLLAAALERERIADKRGHQLQRLADFLEDLNFRKTQYVRNLHDHYLAHLNHLQESAMLEESGVTPHNEEREVDELTAKFRGFAKMLSNLVPCANTDVSNRIIDGTPRGELDVTNSNNGSSIMVQDTTSVSQEHTPGAPVGRASKKRGRSQSLQRDLAEKFSASPAPASTHRDMSADSSTSGLDNEASFLREENRRLRQQLEQHPEVTRLAAENRLLRTRVASLDPSTGALLLKKVQAVRMAKKLQTAGLASLSPSSHESTQSPTDSSDEDDGSDRTPKADARGENVAVTMPPVTSQMLLRSAEVDDDSALRTWVFFQKMAKEVEELLRAKESLSGMVKQVRQGHAPFLGSIWGKLPTKLDSSSLNSTTTTEPLVLDELAQNVDDALNLAQTILDTHQQSDSDKGLVAKEATTTSGGSEQNCAASNKIYKSEQASMMTAVPGQRPLTLTHQRGSMSAPNFAKLPAGRGLAGFLARNKAQRGLVPVSEQESQHGGVQASSPRPTSASGLSLRQVLQKLKLLQGTVDLVNNAYNDVHEQFERLRDEYEVRLEECQFYEMQCSRLDFHCHGLTERLHGSGASVRAGFGSFSATGFSPTTPSLRSEQQRSFSLSSLRDVNFWDKRFQELSQLTGIEEADSQAPSARASPFLVGTPRLNQERPLAVSDVTISTAAKQGFITGASKIKPQSSGYQQPTRVIGSSPGLHHSTSMSAISHADKRFARPTNPSWESSAVRRVASAPLLASFADLQTTSPGITGTQAPTLVASISLEENALAPRAPIPASARRTDPCEAKIPAFDAATFLSLFKPGDKSAALQYVRQSTASALSHTGPVPTVPVMATTSSVASLHGSPVGQSGAAMLSTNYSSNDLRHDQSRARASQPPPLSLSGRLGGRPDGMSEVNVGSNSSGSVSARGPPHRGQIMSVSPRMTASVAGTVPTIPSATVYPSLTSPAGSMPAAASTILTATQATPLQRQQSITRPRYVGAGTASVRGPTAVSPASLQARHGA